MLGQSVFPVRSISLSKRGFAGKKCSDFKTSYGLVIIPQEEKGVEPAFSCKFSPPICSKHHQCGCPGVSLGTALCNDGDRCRGPEDRRTAARIHSVRKAASLHLDPVTVVPGGRNGGIR